MIIKVGTFYLDPINNNYSREYTNVLNAKNCKHLTFKQSIFLSVLINAGSESIVDKQTIIDQVWQGVTSQESLTQMVNKIRGIFEDHSKKLLVNHLKIGYSLKFELIDTNTNESNTVQEPESQTHNSLNKSKLETFSNKKITKNHLRIVASFLFLLAITMTVLIYDKHVHTIEYDELLLNNEYYPNIISSEGENIEIIIENHKCVMSKNTKELVCG